MGQLLSRAIAAAVALGFAAGSAAAQTEYPRRQITLIVPFAAGGPTDVVARIAADHMTRTLGQPVIIENVVGAGGTTASTRAARAAPDGYTIEMGHMGTHAASVALYPNLAYKPDVDFAPIGLVAGTPVLIVAKKEFPAKDLKEFVTYVKANVATLNMAQSGDATQTNNNCDLLNKILGVKPAERSPALPNVPTSKEAGLPEFQAQAWNALFAPKDTPQPVLDKLSDALDKALDDELTRKRLLELGSVLPDKAGRGQQALAALVKSEIARWTPIIKAAGPTD